MAAPSAALPKSCIMYDGWQGNKAREKNSAYIRFQWLTQATKTDSPTSWNRSVKKIQSDGTWTKEVKFLPSSDEAEYNQMTVKKLNKFLKDVAFIKSQFDKLKPSKYESTEEMDQFNKDLEVAKKELKAVKVFLKGLIERKKAEAPQDSEKSEETASFCKLAVKKYIVAAVIGTLLGVAAIAVAIFFFPGTLLIAPVLFGVGALCLLIGGVSAAMAAVTHKINMKQAA